MQHTVTYGLGGFNEDIVQILIKVRYCVHSE